jgi:hypothetical protein
MAWLSQFLLGRPGYEFSFDINPEGMSIDEMALTVMQRNLAGDLKKSVLKTSIPTIKISSSYLALTQRNQFASLVGIQDTFLSFQTRDDWQVIAERNLPQSTTTVVIQNNSATRLSAALVAAGFPGIITINSVSVVPNVLAGPLFGAGGFGAGGFSGPDYFAGGSYADATRTITLGTSLPTATQYVYVTYTYTGWLVNLDTLSHQIQGGWLDRFSYDFQLTGA